jgi:thioredoxin 1
MFSKFRPFGSACLIPMILLGVTCMFGCGAPSPVARNNEPDPFPHVSDDTFATLVNDQSGTVLLDFYADWCGPCKAQARVLNGMAPQLGDVKVMKVDVDACPKLSEQFSVSSIPTLLVFKNGSKVAEHIGMLDEAGIKRLLQSAN